MSAEGRAKLWAREKIEQLAPKPNPERKPHQGTRAIREALCSPKPDKGFDEYQRRKESPHQSERELYFDAAAERAARRRHRGSTGTLPETHAVALGDDSDEDGLT